MTDKQQALNQYLARRLIDKMSKRPCTDCSDAPVNAAPVAVDVAIHGLAVPYGLPTGDGRIIEPGALTWDLANSSVPLIWDRDEGDHSGMIVGVVDELRADDSGVYVERARLLATDDDEAGAAVSRVAELIEANALGWSVALDDEEVEQVYREPQVSESADGTIRIRYKASDDMATVVSARIRHLALVDTPAFPGARPVLGPAPVNAAVAAVATYPAAHFERWESAQPQPVRVDPDGRVWGHAAGDGCYRTGPGRSDACMRYTPDPDPKMRNFHTGSVSLSDGSVIRVGALTAGGLHASPRGSVEAQRRHHEDSTTVWAKVIAWNDQYGRLCITGSVVPGLDPTFLGQVAGLPISGEWWPVPGVSGLTLVGAHTVITPAWPV